jgi:heme/copper-type cytochrome/quinol oxidase subunit 3
MLHLAVLFWGLWVARSLFEHFAAGLVFEPKTGRPLRRFGMALVIYAALAPFVSALLSWPVTMQNAPGKRLVNLGISDHEIVLIIVATLILATGSVMADAARMAEENRQII